MTTGHIFQNRVCPQFSQRLRGFRGVFFTGQMYSAKGTAFCLALYTVLITLLYKYTIYICPKWSIVVKGSKGGTFDGTNDSFYKCPQLSNCPVNT